MSILKRYVVAIAVAIGLLTGCVLAYLALTTPVRRFPLGIAAGDGGDAVLLTRFSDYADSRVFVDLVAGDAARWSVDTTPVFSRDVDGHTAATVVGDQVLVLGVDKGGTQWLGALARVDGAVRWWAELGPASGDSIGPSLVVDDARAYVISERVDALALADGKRLWSDAAGAAKGLDVRLVAGRLWVTRPDGVGARELERETGKVLQTLALDAVLCASPKGLVGVRHNVAAWHPFGGARVELALGDARFAFTSTCGFRGDDVVLTFLRDADWSVARVALGSGRIAWEQVIGRAPIVSDPVMVDAALPRIVPIALCAAEPYPGFCEAIIVDVDAGSLVTRRRTGRVPETVVPIITPDGAWLWLPTYETLVDVDAAGRVGGSRRFAGLGLRTIAPDDLRDGRLWLAGNRTAHPDEVPWIAYDLGAGAVVGQHGELTVEDGRGLVEQVLIGTGARP